MTSIFNVVDDFQDVVDNTEAVVLNRRDSSQNVAIDAARQQSIVTQESRPSDGAVRQADAVWHLPMPEGESAPQLGDVLIDAEGRRWTVLETRELPALGRWKCETRELSIAFGCVDRVDIERAMWDDLGSGPEIVGWVYVRTSLPVKIQPQEMTVDTSSTPWEAEADFEIILSQSIALEPGDRFVAEDGTIYALQAYKQTECIDALPIAKVLRE